MAKTNNKILNNTETNKNLDNFRPISPLENNIRNNVGNMVNLFNNDDILSSIGISIDKEKIKNENFSFNKQAKQYSLDNKLLNISETNPEILARDNEYSIPTDKFSQNPEERFYQSDEMEFSTLEKNKINEEAKFDLVNGIFKSDKIKFVKQTRKIL